MKKKIDRKLNRPRYKFFAFLLISRKFIFLSLSLLATISIVFQSVTSQLKGMVTARKNSDIPINIIGNLGYFLCISA